MDKYVDLLDLLRIEKRDDFYLDLEEIETIVGQPMPKSAYIYPAYWSRSGTHYLANQIYQCGYVVYPDLKNKRIRLLRVGHEKQNINRQKTDTDIKSTVVRIPKLPHPCEQEVEYYLHRWDELEDYSAQEEAVNRVFKDYASNKRLDNILIKCSVLNDFYSTNIFKIYPVAKHILSLDIDERLSRGDPLLVDLIAKVTISNKEKNFYSFASKYCSHHNQIDFPIYDSYVHRVLVYFRRKDHFYEFTDNDLKIYPRFKNILMEFRSFYKLDKYNLKQIDKYLWQLGKEYLPKNY